jgi:hypothetical protein
MSYERIYNENENVYKNDRVVEDTTNDNNNIEMNSVDNWRLKTLYVDTQYVCAAKTDEVLTSDQLFAQHNRKQTHPSCLPVILKDSSRPYTYYTTKSYGDAQDNNYYVNFDDHVSGAAAMPSHHYNNYSNGSSCSNNTNVSETMFENEYGTKMSVDDSGCAKTYLCSLLGCFICCLFQMKPV